MRKTAATALATTVALVLGLTACSGGAGSDEPTGGTTSDGGATEEATTPAAPTSDVTLTYWATNQAASIPADEEILNKEIAKFTEQTGVKVDLEVVPWTDINNRILAATTTRRGPDVLNFGNTNSYMFGSTGALMAFDDAALQEVGGTDRYIPSVFAVADLDTVTSLPLYSQAYGLFYNKQMFADAGLQPPTTWQEFLDDAQKLTNKDTGVYGLSFPGASISMTMHLLYILGRQNGGTPFDADSKPTFTTDGMVAGADQFVDMWRKGIVLPGSVQYTNGGDSAQDFIQGKAAMMIMQSGTLGTLSAGGMTPDQYGVVPVPVLDPLPTGGDPVTSIVAGTNIAIFDSTEHKAEALQFVKFMTSPEEMAILDGAYQLLPVLKDAVPDFIHDTEAATTFVDVLKDGAAPLPVTGDNNSFQTNAGGAITQIVGRVANGETVSKDDIKKALSDAQDKMPIK